MKKYLGLLRVTRCGEYSRVESATGRSNLPAISLLWRVEKSRSGICHRGYNKKKTRSSSYINKTNIFWEEERRIFVKIITSSFVFHLSEWVTRIEDRETLEIERDA